MKAYSLIIAMVLGVYSVGAYAATPTSTSTPKPTPTPASTTVQQPALSFYVIGFDPNNDKQTTVAEIQSGENVFVVRYATSNEIDQLARGLFIGNDGHYYMPAAVADLQSDDVDENGALIGTELDSAGIKLAREQNTKDGKQFIVSSFEDNGISYVRFEKLGSEVQIKLVPIIGSTPIRTYSVEMMNY